MTRGISKFTVEKEALAQVLMRSPTEESFKRHLNADQRLTSREFKKERNNHIIRSLLLGSLKSGEKASCWFIIKDLACNKSFMVNIILKLFTCLRDELNKHFTPVMDALFQQMDFNHTHSQTCL